MREKDPYNIRAHKEGYPSRAVYKLMEIEERFHVLEGKKRIIDLGASPGSWSKYSYERTGAFILSIDMEPFPIEDVHFFKGDIRDHSVIDTVKRDFGFFDLLLSDAAPKMSGISTIDQARAIELSLSAFTFADCVLRRGGDAVVKSFQGEGFKEFYDSVKHRFKNCRCFVPQASRKHSSEIYIMGKGFIA
ncbi:MAG: RlmE family RNA methyltransferase [Candidatus Thermoplasmatota archaeon]|nr:RlmE family RNA methyltransferase [Candidatus Thermoplasmatota archaeon]